MRWQEVVRRIRWEEGWDLRQLVRLCCSEAIGSFTEIAQMSRTLAEKQVRGCPKGTLESFSTRYEAKRAFERIYSEGGVKVVPK